MITARQRLFDRLDTAAAEKGLPSLVVADQSGLLIAASAGSTGSDETAALSALRAEGNDARSEVVEGRVKARAVDLGDEQVIVGALGDTAIVAQVFDDLEETVRNGLTPEA